MAGENRSVFGFGITPLIPLVRGKFFATPPLTRGGWEELYLQFFSDF
jgi:hypothetical protein